MMQSARKEVSHVKPINSLQVIDAKINQASISFSLLTDWMNKYCKFPEEKVNFTIPHDSSVQ